MKLNPTSRKMSEVMARLPDVFRCKQDEREAKEPEISQAVR